MTSSGVPHLSADSNRNRNRTIPGDQPPNLCPECRPCSFEVSIMRLICHFVQAAVVVLVAVGVAFVSVVVAAVAFVANVVAAAAARETLKAATC